MNKITIAKMLDEYAGRLIIWLGFRLKLWRRRLEPADQVRKILFIKLWGLGSVILSEPALRHLRQIHPDADIHYLTLAPNRDLFTMIPVVGRVYTLSFGNPVTFLFHSLMLLRRLRAEHYGLVVDGEFFAHYSVLMARASTQGKVVGFAQVHGSKKHLLDHPVPFYEDRHTVEQFLNLVNAGPRPPGPLPLPTLILTEQNKPQVLSEPYVVINVNASALAVERRWPSERFRQLAQALLDAYDFDLVFIGAQDERHYVSSVTDRLGNEKRVRNWAGHLTLNELAHCLKGAAVLISNDSGPIHMASALQVPIVGLYGPETPERYGPLSPQQLVVYQNLWCSPCMTVENAKTVRCINHMECMKTMEADSVIEQVRQFIDQLSDSTVTQKTSNIVEARAGEIA